MFDNKLVEEELVGREEDLAALWQTLRAHSILLVGARRIGKTSVLTEMQESPPKGWRCVMVDLQGAGEQGLDRITRALLDAGLGPSSLIEGAERIQEVSIGGVASVKRASAAPQTPLGQFEQLVAHAVEAADGPLVLMLDEVPWWLDALEPDDARQVLAVLRHLRGIHSSLRMVLTGSVGLAGLTSQLNATAEINDLDVVELGPLTPAYGATLFERHLLDANRRAEPGVALYAHVIVGGSPYWLQLLARRTQGQTVGKEAIERAAEQLVSHRMRHTFADEGWSHLNRRYGPRATVFSAVLSAAAGAETTERNVLVAAAMGNGKLERSEAEAIVNTLVDAFYLEPVGDGYRWFNPLFRRWWSKNGAS